MDMLEIIINNSLVKRILLMTLDSGKIKRNTCA